MGAAYVGVSSLRACHSHQRGEGVLWRVRAVPKRLGRRILASGSLGLASPSGGSRGGGCGSGGNGRPARRNLPRGGPLRDPTGGASPLRAHVVNLLLPASPTAQDVVPP